MAFALAATALAFAVKVALVPPAEMLTEAGTVRLPLLLEMLTDAPPDGAGEERPSEQEIAPAPVSDAGPHVSELSVAAGSTVMTALLAVTGTLLPVPSAA